MMFVGEKYKYIYTGSEMNINRIRLAWHITDWCNYSCPYCIQTVEHHYDSHPKETQEYVESIARILREKFTNQKVTLTLYGGEISTYYDLYSIVKILFEDNNCDATVTLLTNLSAPIEKYKSLAELNSSKLRIRIIPSYQWSNSDVFIEKCKVIKQMLGDVFQVTCVVYDKTSLHQLKMISDKFKNNHIPIRFTHGRIPKSYNVFYELQEGVSEFIKKWNEFDFEKVTCRIIYSDGNEKFCKARSDILKEVSEWEGKKGADFTDMMCFTGLTLTPSGNIRCGSCADRDKLYIGNVFSKNFSLKPYKAKCEGKGFCNLCNSILIWNGRY